MVEYNAQIGPKLDGSFGIKYLTSMLSMDLIRIEFLYNDKRKLEQRPKIMIESNSSQIGSNFWTYMQPTFYQYLFVVQNFDD